MIVAIKAANAFLAWLVEFNHPKDAYADLGDAVGEWLTADDGIKMVAFNYQIFLGMILVLLSRPESSFKIRVKEKKFKKLAKPTGTEWIAKIGPDVFELIKHDRRD